MVRLNFIPKDKRVIKYFLFVVVGSFLFSLFFVFYLNSLTFLLTYLIILSIVFIILFVFNKAIYLEIDEEIKKLFLKSPFYKKTWDVNTIKKVELAWTVGAFGIILVVYSKNSSKPIRFPLFWYLGYQNPELLNFLQTVKKLNPSVFFGEGCQKLLTSKLQASLIPTKKIDSSYRIFVIVMLVAYLIFLLIHFFVFNNH